MRAPCTRPCQGGTSRSTRSNTLTSTRSGAEYIEYVEQAVDVEVTMIGTGADRERVLTPRGLRGRSLASVDHKQEVAPPSGDRSAR